MSSTTTTASASFRQFYPESYPSDFKGLRMPSPLAAGGHSIPAAKRPESEWYSVHGVGVPLVAVPGWVFGKQLTRLLKNLTVNGGGGWPGVVLWFNFIISGVLLIGLNLWLYGAPLATQPGDRFFVPAYDQNRALVLSNWPLLLLASVGLLLDQQWGLLIYAPIFVLAIVGAAAMWRQPAQRMTLCWLALLVAPY